MCINKIITRHEKLNNDEISLSELPTNDISYGNEYNLTVPTHDQTYNMHDTNRPNNMRSHQHINESELENSVDNRTILVNTSGDTPLVYSLDEISSTIQIPANLQHLGPSITPLDAGSGDIEIDNGLDTNNDKLKNFNSIE
jgi:hypothetical protein